MDVGQLSGMRPLTVLFPDHSRALLQQEINRHQDARYDHRLHCVLLVASGMSCEKVASLFGDSPRTVVNWVRRLDGTGLAGLAEGNHSGRPTRLSPEQLEEVRGLVRQPPPQAEIDANLWNGKNAPGWSAETLSGADECAPVPASFSLE
jgi:transposase